MEFGPRLPRLIWFSQSWYDQDWEPCYCVADFLHWSQSQSLIQFLETTHTRPQRHQIHSSVNFKCDDDMNSEKDYWFQILCCPWVANLLVQFFTCVPVVTAILNIIKPVASSGMFEQTQICCCLFLSHMFHCWARGSITGISYFFLLHICFRLIK